MRNSGRKMVCSLDGHRLEDCESNDHLLAVRAQDHIGETLAPKSMT